MLQVGNSSRSLASSPDRRSYIRDRGPWQVIRQEPVIGDGFTCCYGPHCCMLLTISPLEYSGLVEVDSGEYAMKRLRTVAAVLLVSAAGFVSALVVARLPLLFAASDAAHDTTARSMILWRHSRRITIVFILGLICFTYFACTAVRYYPANSLQVS